MKEIKISEQLYKKLVWCQDIYNTKSWSKVIEEVAKEGLPSWVV